MNVTMLRSFVAISFLALATAAPAQDVDESALDALDKANANAVPAIREPAGAVELRAAMRRISYNSSDADALADAGNAALILGDANAALNFLTRANTARPNNSRTVAGLAAATVQTENPFEALRLFDDAIRLGVSERSIAADRALAFDLLGNFSRAQQDYKLARTASTSDDLIIRQAISLSLGGQAAEADAMLIPLLQKNSAAAWRARAFMLAARGEFRESTKVTEGFMDAASAQRMERYLRLMPDLTGAQQAAAIHLGHFPASQYVGRDSDQVRRVASTIPPVEPSPGERRLIPAGDPLGPKNSAAVPAKNVKKTDSKRDTKAKEQEEIKTAVANIPDSIKLPKTDRSRLGTETARAKVEEAQSSKISAVVGKDMPPPESARPLVKVALPQADQPIPSVANTAALPSSQSILAQSSAPVSNIGFSAPVPAPPPVTMPPPTVIAPNSTPTTLDTTATVPPAVTVTIQNIPAQGPTLDGAPIAPSIAPPLTTAPATVPVAAAPAFDLAAIVGSIKIPESEQKPSAVPVDLKKIKPTLPKTAAVDPAVKNSKLDPKAAAKAKEPLHPARFWVQIATGEANALGFDYRKWSKKTPDLFKAQSGWTSAWGKTSRLLVGPFADMKVAKKWEGDFRKAGGNGFMWKSENGVVVTALKSK